MDEGLPDFGGAAENEDQRVARALLRDAIDRWDDDEPGEVRLAAVEEALVGLGEDPDQEALVTLLHMKCHYLEQAKRFEEALAVCQRELEVATEGEEASGATGRFAAHAFLMRASIMESLGRTTEALEDTTAFLEHLDSRSRKGAYWRRLGAFGASLQLRQLAALGRLDEMTTCWAALLDEYGNDPDPPIRSRVAMTGALAAGHLVQNKKRKRAISVADEVISRFQSSDQPRTRAAVAVAMTTKIGALRGSGRLFATTKAGSALLAYLGPDPDPEVTRLMQSMQGGERAVRLARWSERP